ncbi:MAG: hypothetical protein J7M39_00070 [Anaerolineae bacterium]|nr:hypothetical protein [Anaerolineae bacterium]
MTDLDLAPHQLAIAHAPLDRRIFLEGPAGTGKTTAGVARLHHLLDAGVPADSIQVLVPQRTLGQPYAQASRDPERQVGGVVNVATVGGLARRMIDIFWPLAAEVAGFGDPDERPTFLTLETAQYYMAHVVGPLIEREGYFDAITIDRNRLYSQILDNLNKSAVVGFDPAEISERLKGAWMGEQAQSRVYDEAQSCAVRFRRYCLEHNLLDFSLQVSVFAEHLWQEPLCRDYLTETTTHLIVDNVEEDTPVAHDIIYSWLGGAASGLIILDQDAGYRSFLGADPESAIAMRDLCDDTVNFTESFVVRPMMAVLGGAFDRILRPPDAAQGGRPGEAGAAESAGPPVGARHRTAAERRFMPGEINRVLRFEHHRFHPEMLDWVADEIRGLVHDEGVPPGEIVVLAPFLSDALRFSLTHRLAQVDVVARSHRPSRALRDEPAVQTLLTMAALAHPQWGIVPATHDVAHAMMSAIGGLDLVRAHLLSQIVYRRQDGRPELVSFDEINMDVQQRITFAFGERYERLRNWLGRYASETPAPFDHFLSRLFGEMLSQPGYGFHRDLDGGRVAAMLIESVRKFRWIRPELPEGVALGQEYVRMVRAGVIAAQYLMPWQAPDEDAVLLAPAYTFLLSNRPVEVQVWLNIGGQGWWERLYQPLTHPYVLSRRWLLGKVWTDADEFALRQRSLHRLVTGLVRRCRGVIYLGLSEFSEQGFEQEGPLLRTVQRVLREAR